MTNRIVLSENYGNSSTIFTSTKSNEIIAVGYKRLVVGKRGSYVEFRKVDIHRDSLYIPSKEKYRFFNDSVYYCEYRSKKDNVKVYLQKRLVKYADYKIGFYYVSVNEILANGKEIYVGEKPKRFKFQLSLKKFNGGKNSRNL